MKDLKCRFEAVVERDMDFLIMEEMSCSQEFADMFLSKVGKKGAQIISSWHSKRRKYHGESDLVFVFEYAGKRHALMIEDKIDADAMPDQSGRYYDRGDMDIKDGEYDSYDVFIVAPQLYLNTNSEAIRYPNRLSYEDIERYFNIRDDARSYFKQNIIAKALGKLQNPYHRVEDKKITAFWDGYLAYQRTCYPQLVITNAEGVKGTNSHWVNYKSPVEGTILRHKANRGLVDLEFKGMAGNTAKLREAISSLQNRGVNTSMINISTAGKSGVLRIAVPLVDFLGCYELQQEKVEKCLYGISIMHRIAEYLQRDF